MTDVVNLSEKFNQFADLWHPHIVGELNGNYIKLVRLKGEFVWHKHEKEDELFLVITGSLVIKLRDRELNIQEGEFVIIPKGVEHLPVAPQETLVLLMEPKGTVNTGDAKTDRTVEAEWI